MAAALNRMALWFRAVDPHVAATLFFRSWALVAGIVTVALIPQWLGKAEQGYYFTFSSLVALQIFFELGFNYVVAQLVSHELALWHSTGAESVAAEQYHAARIGSLLDLVRKWYRITSCGFFLLVLIGGAWFFDGQGALPLAAWFGPWVMLATTAALNLYFSPLLAIAEGAGRVRDVAKLRLRQSIAGYTMMWAALLAGTQLWAVVAVPLSASVLTLIWLRTNRDLGLPPLGPLSPNDDVRVQWRTEIFPFQWRIAVSWISGYFIFQLFNPFLFANQGAVEAGRIGMALAAYTAILGLGMSWINATTPVLAGMVARGERSSLNRRFIAVLVRSMTFTAILTGTLVGLVQFMRQHDVAIASRIADLPILALLGATTLANNLIGGLATYMRCHKEEPMLPNSLVTGALVFVSVAIGSRHSVLAPIALYFVITVTLSLPWCLTLFLKRYWRRPQAAIMPTRTS